WIIRPNYGDSQMPSYGVMDESSKININTASANQLLLLPGMTDDTAGAIIDWRDEDSNISNNGGAESEYYMSLPRPYQCKNAPFETVEELLLVKGFTPELLYGQSGRYNPLALTVNTNRMSLGTALSDQSLERGIFDDLT